MAGEQISLFAQLGSMLEQFLMVDQIGNVELVSPPTPSSYMPWQHTQSHNEVGQTEGGDGGVYVYLGSERCYPCKVPHKTFNKMITFKNEVELV